MTNQKHKLKQCPFGTLKCMESSLKRCSTNQHRKSDEDTAFNQTGKKMNGQLNTRPVSAATRIESSLKRCSTNQHRESDKDTAFNQMGKNMNGQLNPGTVPAATRTESSLKRCQANKLNKSGKDAAFSQAGKDMNDKLKISRLSAAAICRLVDDECTRFSQHRKMNSSAFKNSLSLRYGICTSREILIKNVEEKGGELRLALSPIAVKLYKDGTPLAFVVTRVGIQNAFTSVINSISVWVTLRVKNAKLSISKA